MLTTPLPLTSISFHSKEIASPSLVITLLQAISARLKLMSDVAAWKFLYNEPVFSPARELEVLAELVERGGELGLDPEFVTIFFQAQFASAKLYQERYLITNTPCKNNRPPDLCSKTRPKISALSEAMVALLAAIQKNPPESTSLSQLQNIQHIFSSFDPDIIAIALSPWAKH